MIQDRNNHNYFGLYIHIPFCISRCAYCAFYSLANQSDLTDAYITALCREIAHIGRLNHQPQLDSIYVGGGTPSILSSRQITAIFTAVNNHFYVLPTAEISLEANPESVTVDKLDIYRQVGINRLSLGLQAWQDRLLSAMNRPHKLHRFLAAYQECRISGFNNINIDTIFGYPDQSLIDWEETLTEVVKLSPEHISCYSLEVDNHPLLAARLKSNQILAEDIDRKMYKLAKDLLSASGYAHYEISNFAKSALHCRHNFNFWHHHPYLGLGVSAHSYVNGIHSHHENNIHAYIKNPLASIFDSKPTCHNKKLEWLALRLRIIPGFSSHEYLNIFSTSIATDFPESIQFLIKQGLLAEDHQSFHLTDLGFDLYNQVLQTFHSENTRRP